MNLRPAIAVTALFLLASCDQRPAEPAIEVRETTPAGFLERRGDQIYLGGEPFYEISFNKFDLYRQLLAAERGDTKTFGPDPAGRAAKAFRDLAGLGFKTVRVFGDVTAFVRPGGREPSLRAMDRLLELAAQHDIRIVFSFCATDASLPPLFGERAYLDIVARRDTKSRAAVDDYIRTLGTRYRDNTSIAMWETSNELLLKADVGALETVAGFDQQRRVQDGLSSPTAAEVATFHKEVRELIRSVDPNHILTSGDSFRSSQWHLYQSFVGKTDKMWGHDTMEQLAELLKMTQAGVDVFCVHGYYTTVPERNATVAGPDGKPLALTPSDIVAIANQAGQPAYYGEWGALPVGRSEETASFWARNPNWFTSYEGTETPKAAAVVREALDLILAAEPDLTHWWTYQADHHHITRDPQRFDFDLERTPELVALVAGANRALQLRKMGYTYAKVPASPQP